MFWKWSLWDFHVASIPTAMPLELISITKLPLKSGVARTVAFTKAFLSSWKAVSYFFAYICLVSFHRILYSGATVCVYSGINLI